MGTRELRTTLRAVVERVEAGTPVVVLKDGQPLAVMIQHEKRSAGVGSRIPSPPSTHSTSFRKPSTTPQSLPISQPRRPPDYATIRRLTAEPRAILSPLRTVGVSDARAAFATLIEEVAQGRVRTIVARGHLAVAIIPAPEYDRLRVTLARRELVPRRRPRPRDCHRAGNHRVRPSTPRADRRCTAGRGVM